MRFSRFYPGALVGVDGRFHKIGDPFRRPGATLSTLLAPVGTWEDKRAVGLLKDRVREGTLAELWSRPETTTRAALQGWRHLSVAGHFQRPS